MIKYEENFLKKSRNKKLNVEKERTIELEKAATIYIFERDFTSIPGIGNKLKERIRIYAFNGTLDSLNRSNRVQGIGVQKYSDIRQWVERTRKVMPRIIESNFQGKQEITSRYEKQLNDIERDIQNVQKRLSPLYDVRPQAESELKNLNRVTAGTFNKSYRGDREASKLVTEYHIGLFSEWKRVPPWFKKIMEATA